MESGNFLIEGW